MKLLILSPYPREGASFRFRILQYLPRLEAEGIHSTIRCFLSSREFLQVHEPGRYLTKGRALLAGTWRLRRALEEAGEHDAILVHRELYPLGVDWFERRLARTGRPVILDVDDALFLPQPHGNRFLRRFRNPEKIGRLAAASRLVIASNDYLRGHFQRHAPWVEVVPTAIDTDRFCPRTQPRPPGPLVVGWIGSASTTYYLERILPMLTRLRRRQEFVFRVIGAAAAFRGDGCPMVRSPWRLEQEVADVQSLDIGLYPLPEDPWALGKGGFKTIQYMAAGVPVVASPVGVNREIIRHGENGLLAATGEEWEEALSRLLQDESVRAKLGSAGRRTAVAAYSTAVHAPRLAALLREAAGAAAAGTPAMPAAVPG